MCQEGHFSNSPERGTVGKQEKEALECMKLVKGVGESTIEHGRPQDKESREELEVTVQHAESVSEAVGMKFGLR